METNVQPISQPLEFSMNNHERLDLARMLDRCPIKGLAKHRLAGKIFEALTDGWDWFEVDRKGYEGLEPALWMLRLSRADAKGFGGILTEAGEEMICVGRIGRVLVGLLNQISAELGEEIE